MRAVPRITVAVVNKGERLSIQLKKTGCVDYDVGKIQGSDTGSPPSPPPKKNLKKTDKIIKMGTLNTAMGIAIWSPAAASQAQLSASKNKSRGGRNNCLTSPDKTGKVG